MIDERKLIEDFKKEFEPRYNEFGDYECLARMNLNSILKIIEDQPVVNQWISVSERLPENLELVLIQNKFGVMSIASRTGNKWFNFQGTELWKAAAWQPLPKPYKGEEQ